MVGMIDLNTTEEDETTPSSGSLSSPSSSSAASTLSASAPGSSTSSSVCLELWHACAGPLISLPKRGSVVVYFPQGHLEQLPDLPLAVYDLPPHVFCRVVDVKLHAEAASDEVYAQVSLVPESEEIEQKLREGILEGDGEEEDVEATVKATTPHMFCKTLTASDTSTHGGFSVPRRAAEDCFPPLDYTQQRPSQELVAKDLHGSEWKFRHIYRGQPRRHLLTTGWSAFVNKKNLSLGMLCSFSVPSIRGEDGELRLGVRRAAQVKCGPTFPVLWNQHLNQSSLADVASSISMGSAFHIYYNPRASSSEFIIPFNKFLKSLDQSFSAGMRFKMRFETEDAAERRYTGLITGISELDPVRWPGSKWKCVLVRWDDMEANRHSRVSPWEVEPSGSGSVSSSNNFMAPGLKRSRSGLSSSKAEFPIPDGIGASDFRESSRFQEVLQGQEIMSFNTLYDGVDGQNQHPSEIRSRFPGSHGSGIAAMGSGIRDSVATSDNSYKGIGFNESYRFHKVLQGQEIFPSSPYRRIPNANEARENGSLGLSDGIQRSSSRNGWSAMMQGYNTQMRPPTQVSSPSSVLMFQHASNPVPNPSAIFNFNDHKEQPTSTQSWFCGPETRGGKFKLSSHSEPGLRGGSQCSTNPYDLSHEHLQHGISQPIAQSAFRGSQDLVSCKSSCRLFGFSLTEDRHVANKEDNMTSITSLNPGSSFLPCVGEQLHPKPPAINNAVGSSCTKLFDKMIIFPIKFRDVYCYITWLSEAIVAKPLKEEIMDYGAIGDPLRPGATIDEYFNKKRRKYLIQALYKIKTELMLLGFISLLLTVLDKPVANICIPKSVGETFLPCGTVDSSDSSEEEAKCAVQGKVSLLSREGMLQLQYLIFVLASFHSVSSILTFGLGMAKMRRWESWEAETRTLDYQFSTDPRRFQLTHQTSFGKRHLRYWNENSVLRWPACFLRQFYGSVSKVDYLTLRHGFIMAHFDRGSNFDFQKYIRRALDKDFGVVVGISFWIWMFSISFIFFNAHKFYSYYWLPFIPLVMLLLVGTQLQAIITLMCLDSHDNSHVVEGTLLVRPNDRFFWFGRPKLLLQLIQFISFQNSFQLAFFTWTWYKFGFRSCFHRRTEDIVIRLVLGVLVHFLCGYVTLPLYALVTQMGTSMRTAVFTENMVEGLKRWRAKAKKNLKNSYSARPSLDTSLSLDSSPSFSLHTSNSIDWNRPLNRDHVAIEVTDEAKDDDEQLQEHKKHGSFEGFEVSNAALTTEKESGS
ncbi:unnamed protein product [Dovyalis caffra]|uniref:Auxin response factor n=1 Tax=Dovyalis caffra TaxID=77055 RepID=A0AAV1SJT5_9ROSI|nr:unnamed protein product [Dovyalis caffra]